MIGPSRSYIVLRVAEGEFGFNPKRQPAMSRRRRMNAL